MLYFGYMAAFNALPDDCLTFLRNKRIVITGGHGFLGTNVRAYLDVNDVPYIAPTRAEMDAEKEEDLRSIIREGDYVLHLAALCGGIRVNTARPHDLFERNLRMGLSMFRVCTEKKVGKLLIIGTVCEYPDDAPVPLNEESIWNGLPNSDTGAYGMAKRMLLYYGIEFKNILPFPVTHLIPTNIYGPHDHFNPETGHVIPGMIARMHQAMVQGKHEFPVWGNGLQTREFIHAEDACRALLLGLYKDTGPEPINVGSGHEITIGNVAKLIKKYLGYKGQISFDPTAPTGSKRRHLDTARAKKLLGFEAQIKLEEGLRNLVTEYVKTHQGTEFITVN